MPDFGERSEEERELARRERERRRVALDDAHRGQLAEMDGDGSAPEEPEPQDARPRARFRPPSRPRAAAARGVGDPPSPPSPPRQPAPRPRLPRKHSRAGRVMAVVALLLIALVIWFLVELFQPFHGAGHGRVTVTIPPHSSTGQIADVLERNGVISCTFPSCTSLFKLRVAIAGDSDKLLPGTYHLKQDMSFESVLSALMTPPPAAKVSEVTIVPGRTRVEIDRLLRQQGVKGSYLTKTRRSPQLNPASYGAPRSTRSLEGFLYPDTYQLKVPIRISALVSDQLQNFKRHFATVNLGYARSHHLTPYQVLIVASMVEAEAATERDRPLIASVIYNRLRLGMRLQIDATVRYAVDNYTRPITQSQLASTSAWNTYTHAGLPPTPIDGPSLQSLRAAAHPARTNFLYFVVKPCGNGEHAFASTYAQFLREEQQYQSARSQRGGHSPEHCSSGG